MGQSKEKQADVGSRAEGGLLYNHSKLFLDLFVMGKN